MQLWLKVGHMLVIKFSQEFGVSGVTVRNDLRALAHRKSTILSFAAASQVKIVISDFRACTNLVAQLRALNSEIILV